MFLTIKPRKEVRKVLGQYFAKSDHSDVVALFKPMSTEVTLAKKEKEEKQKGKKTPKKPGPVTDWKGQKFFFTQSQ